MAESIAFDQTKYSRLLRNSVRRKTRRTFFAPALRDAQTKIAGAFPPAIRNFFPALDSR
jgi:hypothetical protein